MEIKNNDKKNFNFKNNLNYLGWLTITVLLIMIAIISAIFSFGLNFSRVKAAPSNNFSSGFTFVYSVDNPDNVPREEIIRSTSTRIEAANFVDYEINYAKGIDNNDVLKITIPVDSSYNNGETTPMYIGDDGHLNIDLIKSLLEFNLLVSTKMPIEFRTTTGIELFGPTGSYYDSSTDVYPYSADPNEVLYQNENYVVATNSAELKYQNGNPYIQFEPYSSLEWHEMIIGQTAIAETETSSGSTTEAYYVDVWLGYDYLDLYLNVDENNYDYCFQATTTEDGTSTTYSDEMLPICEPFYLGRLDIRSINLSSSNQYISLYGSWSINQAKDFIERINYSTENYELKLTDGYWTEPIYRFYALFAIISFIVLLFIIAIFFLILQFGLLGAMMAGLFALFEISSIATILALGISLAITNIATILFFGLFVYLFLYYILHNLKQKIYLNTEIKLTRINLQNYREVNRIIFTMIFLMLIVGGILFIFSTAIVKSILIILYLSSIWFFIVINLFSFIMINWFLTTKQAISNRSLTMTNSYFGKKVVFNHEKKIKQALFGNPNLIYSKKVILITSVSIVAFFIFGLAIFLITSSLFNLRPTLHDQTIQSGSYINIQFRILKNSPDPDSIDLVALNEQTDAQDLQVISYLIAQVDTIVSDSLASLGLNYNYTITQVSTMNLAMDEYLTSSSTDLTEWLLNNRFYGVEIYFPNQEVSSDLITTIIDGIDNLNNDLIIAYDNDTTTIGKKYELYDKDGVPVQVTNTYYLNNTQGSILIVDFLITVLLALLVISILIVFINWWHFSIAMIYTTLFEILAMAGVLFLFIPFTSLYGYAFLSFLIIFSFGIKIIFNQSVTIELNKLNKKFYTDKEVDEAYQTSFNFLNNLLILFGLFALLIIVICLIAASITSFALIYITIVQYLAMAITMVYLYYPMSYKLHLKRIHNRIRIFEEDKQLFEEGYVIEEQLVEGINY